MSRLSWYASADQKIGLIYTMLLIFVVLPAIPIQAGQVTVEYSFEYPQMTTTVIDNITYDRIILTGAPNSGLAGQPALPARGAQILIPYGAGVSSIQIIAEDKILIGDGYRIEPVGTPFPLSANPGTLVPPKPDEAIYSSGQPFPATRYDNMGTQKFRGYEILVLKLKPTEYIPDAGELYYYPKLTVVVNTAEGGKSAPLFRGLPRDEIEVLRKIDNAETVASYSSAAKMGGDAVYDLLMIVDPTLTTFFQPLKDYHDTTGILTDMVTTDDIGSNDPESLRDYIRNRYLTDGIEYVLIGGDDDIFPAIDLYVDAWEGSEYFDTDMPGDLYYGCLDGTYNYDGDDRWGEPTDGEGGGDVDLVAEVYVGRASVGSAPEAYNFVIKTMAYLTCDDPYLNNVLMVGEHLTFGGLGEYGGYSSDELIDFSDAHGYTTYGIPSKAYNLEKLYDLTYPGNDWPASELYGAVNDGTHIINHYGHCNTSWALKLSSTDALNYFSNYDYCFIYSQGCYAGNFDGAECWAEYATIKDDQGAFAVVMNARYGWGDWHTDGPSQRFNREFWDAVYNPAEATPEMGRANQDSKEDNIYRIDESCMRWCTYQLTLFGDPTVPFKTVNALAFNYPGGCPRVLPKGQTALFDIEVIPSGLGAAVAGSGQLHYRINGGDVQSTSMTEKSADSYEAVLPALNCDDIIEYYISVDEVSSGTIYDPDPSNPHIAIVSEETIVAFEDDFETDKGWTVSGGLWARGIPTGQGGDDPTYGVPDPTEGCSGPNVYGYNLNGDYENALGEMHLTSPAIDCSNLNNVHLRFWRWLGVECPNFDHVYVRVSNNGTDWIDVWENGSTIADNFWMEMEYDISDVADGEENVYVRWTMGPTDYDMRYPGWNIDDVEVLSFNCLSYVCGDADGSGGINILDVTFIVNYLYKGGAAPEPLEAGDPSGNGSVNVLDISYIIQYLYKGGPPPICPQ